MCDYDSLLREKIRQLRTEITQETDVLQRLDLIQERLNLEEELLHQ